MKALFYVGYPLYWAKGGYTTQILETKRHLENLGVEIAWLHHEDLEFENPRADLIHYWTRPPANSHWEQARAHRYKLAITDILPGAVVHGRWSWPLRRTAKTLMRRMIGRGLYSTMALDIYREADAVISLTSWEAEYKIQVFEAKRSTSHVIPNGINPVFLRDDTPPIRDDALLYVSSIYPLKNNVEVARAAKKAGVPITFVGAPLLGDGDPYFREFRQLVDGKTVKWLGEIRDPQRLAALMRGAAGLLLASRSEGSPLTVMEAIACQRAVMVSDLPNLRSYYGDAISYCSQPVQQAFVNQLSNFYARCQSGLTSTFPLSTWDQVGRQVHNVYKRILGQ